MACRCVQHSKVFFMRLLILFVCFAALGLACLLPETERTYLFLGHPYDWRRPDRLDPRLELIDFQGFDGIWLGGDVCSQTTAQAATLTYLDSLINLKNPATFWAVGNHDLMYGHSDRIRAATGRPLFYTYWLEGVCVLVLNTQLMWHNPWKQPVEACEEREAQLTMIQQLCDSLQAASHLLVLHHHGLFNELKVNEKGDTMRLFNVNAIPVRTGCPPQEVNVTDRVYPWLVSVQNRGIQVICVGGDFGMNAKTFAHRTPAGIWLLGSGINNSLDKDYVPDYVTNLQPDSVLIFTHQPHSRMLNWSFVRLRDLVYAHRTADEIGRIPADLRQLLDEW
jgi:hypothetical protein